MESFGKEKDIVVSDKSGKSQGMVYCGPSVGIVGDVSCEAHYYWQ